MTQSDEAGSQQPAAGPSGFDAPAAPPGYGQPPRGYGQPYGAQPPPGYGLPPPPPGYGQYGRGPAVPAPGGVPFRPLALGDIYSGAVNLARRNPGATFGIVAIMATSYGVLNAIVQLAARHATPDNTSWAVAAVYPVSFLIQFITTGMLTTVIGRGVLGRKIGIGEAWRTSRVAPVLGAALLLLLVDFGPAMAVALLVIVFALAGLTGLAVAVGVLGGICVLAWYILAAIRFSLTMPGVVLEGLGPARALRRSWRLSSGSFWRLFGIRLLTLIIITVASVVIELPFEIAAGAGTGIFSGGSTTARFGTAYVLIVGVGGIIALTLMQPLKSGTTVLLYLDLRMRREGLDLALRNAAQSQQLTGDEFATVWRPPAAGQSQPAGPGPWQPQGQWDAQAQQGQQSQWGPPPRQGPLAQSPPAQGPPPQGPPAGW